MADGVWKVFWSEHSFYEKSRWRRKKKKEKKRKKKIMTFIVGTNVVASRTPERRPTGMPHSHANYSYSSWSRQNCQNLKKFYTLHHPPISPGTLLFPILDNYLRLYHTSSYICTASLRMTAHSSVASIWEKRTFQHGQEFHQNCCIYSCFAVPRIK